MNTCFYKGKVHGAEVFFEAASSDFYDEDRKVMVTLDCGKRSTFGVQVFDARIADIEDVELE